MCFFSPSREQPVLSNTEHFPKLLFKHTVSLLCITDTFILNIKLIYFNICYQIPTSLAVPLFGMFAQVL